MSDADFVVFGVKTIVQRLTGFPTPTKFETSSPEKASGSLAMCEIIIIKAEGFFVICTKINKQKLSRSYTFWHG